MKPLVFALFLMSFVVKPAFAQKKQVVQDYFYQIRANQNNIDQAAKELIRIKQDSTTSDSLKVKIVFILADAGCDICIQHLMDNYFEFFNYGEGISDGDQARQVACLHSIAKMIDDDVDKWKLISPLLNSLKTNRDNTWLEVVSGNLSQILTKPVFKAFLDNEIEKNYWAGNEYIQNLQKIWDKLPK